MNIIAITSCSSFNDDDERVPIEQRKRPPESFTSKNNILSISEDITAKQSTSFGNRYPLSSHVGETIESNNKSSLVSSQRYKDYIDRIAGRQIIAEGDQYRDDGLVSRDSTIYEHHQNRQQPYFNYDTQQWLIVVNTMNFCITIL